MESLLHFPQSKTLYWMFSVVNRVLPGAFDMRSHLDNIHRSKASHTEEATSPRSTLTTQPVEMGYLNLTSSPGVWDSNLNLTSPLTRADHNFWRTELGQWRGVRTDMQIQPNIRRECCNEQYPDRTSCFIFILHIFYALWFKSIKVNFVSWYNLWYFHIVSI